MKDYEVGSTCNGCGTSMRSPYLFCNRCMPLTSARVYSKRKKDPSDQPMSKESSEWLRRALR